MPNLVHALVDALCAHGAKAIFGLPGDFALPLFRAAEQYGKLPIYTLSHEPAVGFAADACARATQGVGVAFVTYGAGGLNLVNATACALAEKSPLVVVSGAPGVSERAGDLLLHHQGKTLESQYRVFREVTCDQAVLDRPLEAPKELARVLQNARDFSQPVYIEVPRDLVDAPCEELPRLAPASVDRETVTTCAQEVLERLARARAPVMMVGVEVKRYRLEQKVALLAQALGLPVVTSFMGRGLLADGPVRPLGTYLGVAGEPEITELVENSDGLLLLGVILSDSNLGASRKRVNLRWAIHAGDRRVTLGFHTYAPVPLEAFVDALLELTQHHAGRFGARAHGNIPPEPYPRGLARDDAPLQPDDIACAVNDFMDAHGAHPIAADM
jgi:indolepyruvate decarboxylase